MIQGRSNFVYRVVGTNKFVSLGLRDQYETQEIHVDVNIVRNDILDLDAFRAWRPEFKDAEFILREQVRLRLGDRKDVEVDVQRREPRLHRR